VAVPTAYASRGDFELACQLEIGHLQAASCQANQICHGSHIWYRRNVSDAGCAEPFGNLPARR
jgi:hypothetical protein